MHNKNERLQDRTRALKAQHAKSYTLLMPRHPANVKRASRSNRAAIRGRCVA